VQARQWQSIIEHNIYKKSNIEKNRYSLKIEEDPFFFPEDIPADGDVPTMSPKGDKWVTLSPTNAPSSVPSDSPSLAPTEWDISLNGGCRFGHELFEVHMYDSWGDGWDSTLLVLSGIEDQDPSMVLPSQSMTRTITDQTGDVTVLITRTVDLDDQSLFNPDEKVEIDPLGVMFQGTLRKGSHDFANVCLLPRRCYQVTVAGGEFLNEVSWDIRPGNLDSTEPTEPILSGGAPSGCTFSLPDEYGHHFCANTCSNTLPPNAITSPPKIIGNLQVNTASGSKAISEATGETVSTNFGTKRTSNGNYRGNGIGSRGYGTSDILSNFEPVKDDENGND
jgi:hypothetical protein